MHFVWDCHFCSSEFSLYFYFFLLIIEYFISSRPFSFVVFIKCQRNAAEKAMASLVKMPTTNTSSGCKTWLRELKFEHMHGDLITKRNCSPIESGLLALPRTHFFDGQKYWSDHYLSILLWHSFILNENIESGGMIITGEIFSPIMNEMGGFLSPVILKNLWFL